MCTGQDSEVDDISETNDASDRGERHFFVGERRIAYNRQCVLAGVDAGHGNLYLAECVDGKVAKQSFVEKGQLSASDAAKIEFSPLASVDKTLAEVASIKAKNGEFVSVFEPFYMRKSQAEREKDEV